MDIEYDISRHLMKSCAKAFGYSENNKVIGYGNLDDER